MLQKSETVTLFELLLMPYTGKVIENNKISGLWSEHMEFHTFEPPEMLATILANNCDDLSFARISRLVKPSLNMTSDDDKKTKYSELSLDINFRAGINCPS